MPANAFQGKIVLIGLTAAGTSDVVTTPRAIETYGVFVQAQAVDARKGQRPVELAVFDANITAAEAKARDAQAALRRVSILETKGFEIDQLIRDTAPA